MSVSGRRADRRAPTRLLLRCLSAALTLMAMLAVGATAPRVSIASLGRLPMPLPKPYDDIADADAQVNSAAASGRPLLSDLGGNRCGDRRVIAGVKDLPEVKAPIAARYGITERLEGVPSLLIVDPRSNKVLDDGHVAALADARSSTPQALADWFAQSVRL